MPLHPSLGDKVRPCLKIIIIIKYFFSEILNLIDDKIEAIYQEGGRLFSPFSSMVVLQIAAPAIF
uniref:NIK-associated protein n=1 Tax=Homo sapiens TaxID=9606 RepID=Q8IX17_HUMAN|nr:NIK-associated protein [Homo sapiens]